MGRRSRKRPPAGTLAPERPVPPPARHHQRDERPRAPWHPFPLVELCALLGIVLLVLGLFDLDSERGRILFVAGMAIGSLAGLDTALREHFSGFRSHSLVLAGIPGVGAAVALYFSGVPWPAVVIGAVAAFAGSFVLLSRAYQRR
jgi:hypothetical protein